MPSLLASVTPKAAKERRNKKMVSGLTTKEESWRKWIEEKQKNINLDAVLWDRQVTKYGQIRNVSTLW